MKKKIRKAIMATSSVTLIALLFMSFTPGFQKPWVVPANYKTKKNPTTVDAANLSAGKALYIKHCKACHGTLGKGDGPKAAMLKTKMPDLTSKTYKTLIPGEKYYRAMIGRDEMPNFETKIPELNDRWYVINYIESLK
jgi:mono/diheme cytochrome c family protein